MKGVEMKRTIIKKVVEKKEMKRNKSSICDCNVCVFDVFTMSFLQRKRSIEEDIPGIDDDVVVVADSSCRAFCCLSCRTKQCLMLVYHLVSLWKREEE